MFHNRRGHASVISCEDCGHIINCPECDLPLVLHGTSRLTCHHCRYKTDLPPLCPACAQPNIKLSGKGTQRVEQEIKNVPHANIIRLDSDSPASKKIHPHATIIIGTEYALSRLDWNSISLIGIINADQALYRPDFRASERTYQLLKRLQLKSEILNLKSFFIQTYNPKTLFSNR